MDFRDETHQVGDHTVVIRRFATTDEMIVSVNGENYDVFQEEDGKWYFETTEGTDRDGGNDTADDLLNEWFLNPEGP